MNAPMTGKSAARRMNNMPGKKPPADAQADAQNANQGSPGTNPLYDKAQGNRGKQLDPKQRPPTKKSP